MNNTFNVTRFGRLLKKTLLERPMHTFGFTGLMLVISLILYFLIKIFAYYDMAQRITFFVGLIGGSFFLASFVFGYFSSNASGSSFLTLPASTFEKWLCGILITAILYPLIFLLFFRVMDLTFVGMYHDSLDPTSPFYKLQYEHVYLFDLNGFIALNVYALFFIYVGAMLIGSLYFNKTAIIKVALALAILFGFIVGLNWLIAISLFRNVEDAWPFNHVIIRLGNETGSLEMPSAAGKVFKYTVIYFFPAAVWLLSFTRLREKEF